MVGLDDLSAPVQPSWFPPQAEFPWVPGLVCQANSKSLPVGAPVPWADCVPPFPFPGQLFSGSQATTEGNSEDFSWPCPTSFSQQGQGWGELREVGWMSSHPKPSFCERTMKKDKGKDFSSSDIEEHPWAQQGGITPALGPAMMSGWQNSFEPLEKPLLSKCPKAWRRALVSLVPGILNSALLIIYTKWNQEMEFWEQNDRSRAKLELKNRAGAEDNSG